MTREEHKAALIQEDQDYYKELKRVADFFYEKEDAVQLAILKLNSELEVIRAKKKDALDAVHKKHNSIVDELQVARNKTAFAEKK